ncbi:putative antirepressor domain protein [Escherichia coli DEC10C]|nr:putative antirepressor domain protein [Escherichia coli DEC10C]
MQGLTTLFIRRYILCVAAKSAHGIGVPDIKTTHNRVRGFFMRSARLHKNYGGLCEGFFGSAGFRFDRLRQPCTVHHQSIGVVGGDSSNSKRDYRYGHSARIPRCKIHSYKSQQPDLVYQQRIGGSIKICQHQSSNRHLQQKY